MHSIPTLLLLLILSETTFCMIRIQSTVRYFAFRSSKALFSTTINEVASIQPWSELCKSNAIIEAIRSQGMHMPTDIQCKAYKHILAGGDAVIGAETGSGKTLSYTLPLVDKFLCNEKVNNLENLDVKNIKKYVILSPNQDLCNQIHRMITFLADYINTNTEFQVSVGRSLSVGDMSNPSTNNPSKSRKLEIVICTPKSLRSSLEFPQEEGNHILSGINAIVLDEADMLLDGSYLNDIEEILTQFKLFRRELIRNGSISNSQRIMQFVLAAATIPTFGVKSIESNVKMLFPQAKYIKSSNMHHHHPLIDQTFVKIDNSDLNYENVTARIMKYVHGYVESQMPNYESASYPTIREGLFANEGPSPPSPKWISSMPFSMMIFFNTAKSAQKFGNDLLKLGYDGLYAEVHGALTKQQRAENLAKFMKQERAKILLCTDACARGLDLPFVKCIVQAEFSLNVVQHLHRVGRSSRGGKRGFAVNFFSNSQEQLVKSIKGQLNECHQSLESTEIPNVVMSNNTAKNNVAHQRTSIEESFSRRRGFRRKLRKQEITFDNRGESFHDN